MSKSLLFGNKEYFKTCKIEVMEYKPQIKTKQVNTATSSGTLKAVKRLPKIGEYVKIVNTDSKDYKNGDILQIVDVQKILGVMTPYYKLESGRFLFPHEYVVLEGYQPQKEVVKKEEKVDLSKVSTEELFSELLKRVR